MGETDYVASLLSGYGPDEAIDLCAGIVGRADLALGEAVDAVLDAHSLAGQGRFKGIRYVSAWDAAASVQGAYPTHAGMLLESAVLAGARRLAKRSLSLDLWLYFHQLEEVAALAKACPDLTLVINHCGGPIGVGPYAARRAEVAQQWRSALQALKPLGNVSMKFGGLAMALAGFGWRVRTVPPSSGDLVQAWQPYFDTCLDVFGAGRCMFESNFPVDRTGCSYTVLWNAFKTLAAPLSEAERMALCSVTARHVYRLV